MEETSWVGVGVYLKMNHPSVHKVNLRQEQLNQNDLYHWLYEIMPVLYLFSSKVSNNCIFSSSINTIHAKQP